MLPQKPFISSFSMQSKRGLLADAETEAGDMAMARFIMALRAQGIRNTALLSAFEHVARAAFFDAELADYLYADLTLPLPFGEEASSAHRIAQILNQAKLHSAMRVLEIGTGSGYQTALLATIVGEVVSIERHRSLGMLARKGLSRLGLHNAEFRHGDGLASYDLPASQFDLILINGGISAVPEALLACLRENGVILAPIGDETGQELTQISHPSANLQPSAFGQSRFGMLKRGRAASH